MGARMSSLRPRLGVPTTKALPARGPPFPADGSADDSAVGTFAPDPANVDDVTWTAPATMAATQVVILTLTVTPSDAIAGAMASDSVTITVPGTNPTVSIETVDQDVVGGTVLQLEATSADSDGSTIATYAWTAVLADGSADDSAVGTFAPDPANVEDVTWTAPATTTDDQMVTLTLTVTDNCDRRQRRHHGQR